MKPEIFDKGDFSTAIFCETSCSGYEQHTGRCVGFAILGDGYPRHADRKFCLKIQDAWLICPKNDKFTDRKQK